MAAFLNLKTRRFQIHFTMTRHQAQDKGIGSPSMENIALYGPKESMEVCSAGHLFDRNVLSMKGDMDHLLAEEKK